MQKLLINIILLTAGYFLSYCFVLGETLSNYDYNSPPDNFEAMWEGYNPRTEPLETEIIKQWEEDNIVFTHRTLPYRHF